MDLFPRHRRPVQEGNRPEHFARVEKIDATPNPLSERPHAEPVDPADPESSPASGSAVQMDLELTQAVLARTKEELLDGLAALMRNRVELERTTRRLTQVLEETSEAQRELERVRHQVRDAGRAEPPLEWDDPQQERERLAAELEQLRATYFAYQVESNRSRESLEEEIGMLREEVVRRQIGAGNSRSGPAAQEEIRGRGPQPLPAHTARLGETGPASPPRGRDALKRKLFRSAEQTNSPLEAPDGPVRPATSGGNAAAE